MIYKKRFIICFIIIILLCICIIHNKEDDINVTGNEYSENVYIRTDNENGIDIYYTIDENGEVLHEATDPSSLLIYEYDPNYNPSVDGLVDESENIY